LKSIHSSDNLLDALDHNRLVVSIAPHSHGL